MNPFQTRGDSSIVSAKRKTAAWIKEAAKSSPGGRTETSQSEMSVDKRSRLAQQENLEADRTSCTAARTCSDHVSPVSGSGQQRTKMIRSVVSLMFLLGLSLITDAFQQFMTAGRHPHQKLLIFHSALYIFTYLYPYLCPITNMNANGVSFLQFLPVLEKGNTFIMSKNV